MENTYAELLHLNLPEDEQERLNHITSDFIQENKEILSPMLKDFIEEHHPEVVPILVSIPPVAGMLTNACQLFFYLGYLLGTKNREEIQKLDKLYGGGK